MKKTLLLALALIAVGCGGSIKERAEARYDSGWNDGYAAGYNTTCEIRATMIEGDWDDSNYSSGHRDGYAEGARDCRNGR
jgi:hypothetical protein